MPPIFWDLVSVSAEYEWGHGLGSWPCNPERGNSAGSSHLGRWERKGVRRIISPLWWIRSEGFSVRVSVLGMGTVDSKLQSLGFAEKAICGISGITSKELIKPYPCIYEVWGYNAVDLNIPREGINTHKLVSLWDNTKGCAIWVLT